MVDSHKKRLLMFLSLKGELKTIRSISKLVMTVSIISLALTLVLTHLLKMLDIETSTSICMVCTLTLIASAAYYAFSRDL